MDTLPISPHNLILGGDPMRLTPISIATAVLAVASLTLALTPIASAAATPNTANGPGAFHTNAFPGFPGMPSMGGGFPGMPSMGGFPGMPSMGGSQSVPNGFPKEFKTPTNVATGQPATGWGCDPTGQTDGGVVKHVPILFLHGAMRDAHDWDQARQYYLSKGYSPCELWAVSYGGPGMQGMDATSGAKTVQAFADNMLAYLKQYQNPNLTQIDVVTHSMGGSVAMQWINNGNAGKVHSLITIAAPHHGISLMGMPMPGMSGNNPTAPEGVRTMTIYDGTGWYDMFYPNNLKDSPSLQGATNHPYNVEHNTKYDHISLANQTLDLQYNWLKNEVVTAKN